MRLLHVVEQWRDIPGYEGYYQVSSEGRVKSLPRKVARGGNILSVNGKMLRAGRTGKNYLMVVLSKEGVGKSKEIHTLVAEAFLGPKPPGMVIRHLDGDKHNNRADNLAYGTLSDNTRDSVKHGTHTTISERHTANEGTLYQEITL